MPKARREHGLRAIAAARKALAAQSAADNDPRRSVAVKRARGEAISDGLIARSVLAHPGRCESAASAALGSLARARELVRRLLRWDSSRLRRTLSAARPFCFWEALHLTNLARFALCIGAAALFAGCGGSQPPIGAPGQLER